MLKRSILAVAIAGSVLQSAPAFADQWGGRGDVRQDRREDRKENRQEIRRENKRVVYHRQLPGRHFDFWRGNQRFYYSEGRFYRHTWRGFVLVEVPTGIVVQILPTGYATVITDGRPCNYAYGR